MVTLRARKWLDDAEFRELLRISDYLGYEEGVRKFAFNVEKAISNGYRLEDVLNLIRDLGLEMDGSIEELRAQYSSFALRLEWDELRGMVRVFVPKPLYKLTKLALSDSGARRTGEGPNFYIFAIYPIYLERFYNSIKSLGIEVADSGLLAEKPLAIRPSLRGVQLRDYQSEALSKWEENGGKGIIALPTGAGKTLIAIAALVKKCVRTLIVVYTKEQMFQWRDFILKATDIPSGMVGLIYSESKQPAPITITTYQSGFRHINTLSPRFDMLIVDEVHHLPAEKFKYIAIHSMAKYRMGLSATPVREDGRHEELFPLLGGIIYYKSPDELVARGYLAPYEIRTVKVRLSREEYNEYKELRKAFFALANGKKFEELVELAARGDEKAVEALRIHARMRSILAKSQSKIDKAVEIARAELEKGNKVIVFTQYVDQAKEIAERLGAHLLIGEMPSEERKRHLEEFKKSDRGILVVTTVGDEGLDIPDANVGILVSGTGSRRQFIQRLGRLLRPGKSRAILYEIILERTSEEYQAQRRKKLDLGELGEEEGEGAGLSPFFVKDERR